MQNEHEWNEPTPEGKKRIVRASKFGRQWKFQSKLRGQPLWTIHDPPIEDDVASLLDVLQRKYHRRRVSYEDVRQIDDMLNDMRKPVLEIE